MSADLLQRHRRPKNSYDLISPVLDKIDKEKRLLEIQRHFTPLDSKTTSRLRLANSSSLIEQNSS